MRTDKRYLALDVGTTAVKAALFDEAFQMLDAQVEEYTLNSLGKGIVELPAEVYWEKAKAAVRKVVKRTKTDPETIRTITAATQGETLILADEEGNALHPAVVWLDARAQEEQRLLSSQYEKEVFFEKTGIPEVTAYCPIAKILWFRNNLPEIYHAAHKILLLEDYLIFKLTNQMVTNPAVSCTTGYLDITTGRLWEGILEKNGLEREKFPEIRPCGTQVGTLSKTAAKELGLTERTVVTTGAMDQAASAIGAGNIKDGIVSETTGTCMCVAVSAKDPGLKDRNPAPVYRHGIDGLYLKVSVVQTAGLILKWFRDAFCQDLMKEGRNAYDAMSALAEAEPPLSKGVTLVPFLTGTEQNSQARGEFCGLGLETTRGCLIRAVMEAVGYMLRQKLAEMGVKEESVYALGGASKSGVWNQIKADICGRRIAVLEVEESTCLGAAMLGALAVGDIGTMEEAAKRIRVKKRYEPSEENEKRYREGYERFEELCSRALKNG